jgi:hypothetical protein
MPVGFSSRTRTSLTAASPLRSILDFPSAEYPVCFDIGRFMFSCTVINTTLELAIALLPIPAAFHLQLDRRQRWSVVSVLSVGVFVAIIGCVRCYYVYVMAVATYDVTWWAEAHWICSQVEIDVSLVSPTGWDRSVLTDRRCARALRH